jgi:16S rRNA C967 or C1407 C5-methylase (RsmB/RsmF family)/NOL1/NOP2/fmu family ribosome biogenesis protein
LYYLQDPSAMSPAELLAPQPGERVLDLSAAPGGKTTHLAALMRGEGLLVANEIKDKRVGHLAQNVERWGAGNVVITNETPERLADYFGAFFDRVLVDAPCSGEGMFRKDMAARADWSPEMVAGCAVRQVNILRVAGKLVRPGGFLLYSTCTFAPEEDEGVIAQFLAEFADFEVTALPRFEGFTPGRPEWVVDARADCETDKRMEAEVSADSKSVIEDGADKRMASLRGAVRLFPHRLAGEGHFVCLLQRRTGGEADRRVTETDRRVVNRMGNYRPVEREALRLWRAFAGSVLSVDFAEDRLRVAGERLYFVPEGMPEFGRLRVVHAGTWLGVLKKDRFEPVHPLALCLRAGDVRSVIDFSPGDPRLAAYLRGEVIESAAQGWTLVTVDGLGLGWGKGVQGVLKNHYPRGWMQR